MGVCHSVHLIDGKLVGHFVDREMFRATNYTLFPSLCDTPGQDMKITAKIICSQNEKEFFIVKRFDFNANIQLASVIYTTKTADASFFVCAKGSPEAIQKVCLAGSIPVDYRDTYKRYSGQGYYVIAFAEKCIDAELNGKEYSHLPRGSVESNLIFTGFALFRSPIKPESYDTIKQLEAASIRSIIITGDNGLTAINVVRQLNMGKRFLFINKNDDGPCTFSEIPFTDDEWSVTNLDRPLDSLFALMLKYRHDEYCIGVNCLALNYILDNYNGEFVNWLMENAMVFSRAKPRDKTRIVQKLIHMGHYTMHVGDGSNDCGALKVFLLFT